MLVVLAALLLAMLCYITVLYDMEWLTMLSTTAYTIYTYTYIFYVE